MQRLRLSSWQTCCRSFKGYGNALSVIPRALLLLYGCRIENRKNHPRKSRVVFYLSHCSVSSHERGQLLNPLQRERRERHRLHGDRHQLHRVIVSRCAVGMQYTAASAAMNHCPLTVFANPDTDGVHDAAAVSGTVARLMGIPPEKSIFSSFGEVVYGFSRPPGQLTESNSPYFFKKQSSFNYLSLSASFTLSQKLLRLT